VARSCPESNPRRQCSARPYWHYHPRRADSVAGLRTARQVRQGNPGGDERAAEQRDAADEGRLEPSGNILVGPVIVNQGKVVRPSQLIASVRQTMGGGEDLNATVDGLAVGSSSLGRSLLRRRARP
jgi:hypothetical protein